MKRRRKEKTKKQKNKEFTRNKVQKKRGDIFSNVGEMKNMWYKNLTQEGDVKHSSKFSKHIFENQGIFFRNGLKRNRKNRSDSSKRRVFFVQKKSGEDRKTGDAKVDKKNSENHRNQKEGQTEQDKMCAPQKIKQRDQSKQWGKGRWKKTKLE